MGIKKRLFIGCSVAVICLFLIIHFLKKQKVDGWYVGKNFSKNIDSIQILPNGFYKRVVYNNNGKLIFKNSSRYSKHDSKVSFNDFLLNKNDIEAKDSLNYNLDDLTYVSLNINI